MLVACSFVCFGLIFAGVFQFMRILAIDVHYFSTVGLPNLSSDMLASPNHRLISWRIVCQEMWLWLLIKWISLCVGTYSPQECKESESIETWDMNQSLIYEVRHSLRSVLAQLSSHSSHPVNKLPCNHMVVVGFRIKSFRRNDKANRLIKAYVLRLTELNKGCWCC